MIKSGIWLASFGIFESEGTCDYLGCTGHFTDTFKIELSLVIMDLI